MSVVCLSGLAWGLVDLYREWKELDKLRRGLKKEYIRSKFVIGKKWIKCTKCGLERHINIYSKSKSCSGCGM